MAQPPGYATSGETALRRSIIRNLSDIINSRLGGASAQPSLGTPPPCELIHNYPACIPVLQKSLERCIARYEPRLSDVRVAYVPGENPLCIPFQISARLTVGSRNQLSFKTQVNQTGRIQMG
jgi:type VI secretion system protein